MATSSTTKTRRAVAKKAGAPGAPKDALALLKADHREVDQMFEQFEDANGSAAKSKLVQQICLALKVHTQIEEEIFYPATRKQTKDNDLVDEAVVEHAAAKDLIAQLESAKPGDDLYDAKVKVLGEQVRHHVQEEEHEMFPEVKQSGMDLVAIGEQMAARKQELMGQLSGKA